MRKCRLVFEKTGTAKYISHLDLMRSMQRIFIRAEVSIVHTQGFNPHPYMVFALPLSVGTESICELMDIELGDDSEKMEDIPARLNEKAPQGIKFKSAYIPTAKFKELAYIDAEGTFEYDNGASEDITEKLNSFFEQDEIIVKKKTKRGISDTDIRPGIKSVSFTKTDNNIITVKCRVTAQEPTTNPELLVSALKEKAPELAPDFAEFRRVKMLNKNEEEFI